MPEFTRTWTFICGHKLTLLELNSRTRNFSTLKGGMPRHNTFPDACPGCKPITIKTQDNKEKAGQQAREAQEAIAAHAAHAEFLKAQITGAMNNPVLQAVFEKMLKDCKLLWAAKVKELQIALAQLSVNVGPLSYSFKLELEAYLTVCKLMFEAENILADREYARNGRDTALAKKLQDRHQNWEQTEKDLENFEKFELRKTMDILDRAENKLVSILAKAKDLLQSAVLE